MTITRDLQRYAALIESLICKPEAFAPQCEDATHIQVERALAASMVDLPTDCEMIVVDAAGHARPVYRPLLIYGWLMQSDAKSIQPGLHRWIESLDDGIWSSLVRAVAGDLIDNKSWSQSAHTKFKNLIDQQQPNGAFLPPDAKAHPETRWYEELNLLHAVASYSVRMNDSLIEAAVRKSAQFHLQETQPDHASAQPWGLLAFTQFATPLADQLLHAMMMQYPAGATGVPLLLLTDVLYGLRRLNSANCHDAQLTMDPTDEQRS